MKLLKLEDVMDRTSLGRSTMYNLLDEGRFPKPVKVGRLNAWPETEIDEWIQGRITERDAA